jgi:outer membrane receptor protein involved in Fe transport
LKPEIARNYELGLRGDMFSRKLSFGATAYRLDRKDLILLVTDGIGTRTINAGKQQSRGIELESKFDLGAILSGLSGFFNYSYTDSEWVNNRFTIEFTNEVFDYSGKKVRGVPEHLFSAGASKTLPKGAVVRAWLDYVGNYFADSQNTVRAGRHELLNASFTVPLFERRMDLQVAATNILDKKYYYFVGYGFGPSEAYPGLPAQVFATVKYRF